MSLMSVYLKFRPFKFILLVQYASQTWTRQYAASAQVPSPSCIWHAVVAEEVAAQVRDRQVNKDNVLIINNPGTGEIVRKFRDLGVEHMACTAVEKGDGNLQLACDREGIFCTSHNVMTVDCETLEEGIVNKLPVSLNERGLTILSTLNERRNAPMKGRVFNTLANKFVAYPGLLDTPHTEFFIFLTASRYKNIRSSPWLLSHKIYHTFFNISHVMELDSTDFDPELITDKGPKSKSQTRSAGDDSKVHLIHLVPNQAVVSQLSPEDRMKFRKFVKLCQKHDTIITFLELYVPGCGIHLIKEGFTMNDENSTLTGHQYFTIYKKLISLPEFEDSSLKLILEDHPPPPVVTD